MTKSILPLLFLISANLLSCTDGDPVCWGTPDTCRRFGIHGDMREEFLAVDETRDEAKLKCVSKLLKKLLPVKTSRKDLENMAATGFGRFETVLFSATNKDSTIFLKGWLNIEFSIQDLTHPNFNTYTGKLVECRYLCKCYKWYSSSCMELITSSDVVLYTDKEKKCFVGN